MTHSDGSQVAVSVNCGCMCAECRWGTHCLGVYCEDE